MNVNNFMEILRITHLLKIQSKLKLFSSLPETVMFTLQLFHHFFVLILNNEAILFVQTSYKILENFKILTSNKLNEILLKLIYFGYEISIQLSGKRLYTFPLVSFSGLSPSYFLVFPGLRSAF